MFYDVSAEHEPGFEGGTGFLRLLHKHATSPQLSKLIFMRHKTLGIWKETSWGDFYISAAVLHGGLLKAGFKPGGKMMFLGQNHPDVLKLTLAVHGAKGVTCYLYPNSVPWEIEEALDLLGDAWVYADTQEQVDKIFACRNATKVLGIIFRNPNGMAHYKDNRLHAIDRLRTDGEAIGADQSVAIFAACIHAVGNSDACHVFISNKVTKARSTAAAHSYETLVNAVMQLRVTNNFRREDTSFSLLPLCKPLEFLLSYVGPLLFGYTVNFPESVESTLMDLAEVEPHHLYATASVWRQLREHVEARISQSHAPGRVLFAMASQTALKKKNEDSDLHMRLGPWIGHQLSRKLVFQQIRKRIGLGRIEHAMTGENKLDAATRQFFSMIGSPLQQIYGCCEVAGIAAIEGKVSDQSDSVERLMVAANTECEISDANEVLLKSSSLAAFSYDMGRPIPLPLANGWLKTGDCGCLDNQGELIVEDRLAFCLQFRGKNFIKPTTLELKLGTTEFIRDALLVSGSVHYLGAILTLNGSAIRRWASRRGLSFRSYADLVAKADVQALLKSEIERINDVILSKSPIWRFAILPKLFDNDDGEISRTGWIRRALVNERYRDLVKDLLRTGETKVYLEIEIYRQDGTCERKTVGVDIISVYPGLAVLNPFNQAEMAANQ